MKRALSVAVLSLGVLSWALIPAYARDTEGKKKDAKTEAKAEVGKPAPDFALKDLDGKEHKLSDHQGKIVVLEWMNCKCPFVMRHQKIKHTMQKTFDQFKGKDVVWFAVYSTNKDFMGGYSNETIKEWVESEDVKLPYAVLRDENGEIGQLYGAKATPHMFVIDTEGKLVYSGAIDNDPSDDKDNDENYVASAVQATLDKTDVETSTTKPYGCDIKYAK